MAILAHSGNLESAHSACPAGAAQSGPAPSLSLQLRQRAGHPGDRRAPQLAESRGSRASHATHGSAPWVFLTSKLHDQG